MKQKDYFLFFFFLFFFLKKNPKWLTLKNGVFSRSLILDICFDFFFLIWPWVSRIDWCQRHWCGSTDKVVRLSNISSKTGKKCFTQEKNCCLDNFEIWLRSVKLHNCVILSISKVNHNPKHSKKYIYATFVSNNWFKTHTTSWFFCGCT